MHMRMPPRPAPRGRDARQHAYDMSYFALKRLSRKRGHVGPPPAAPLKATPPKRTFSEAEAGDDGRAGVEAFLLWCEGVGIGLHPGLRVGRRGSCAGTGVVATREIAAGERLAVIPRSALLSCSGGSMSDVVASDSRLQQQLSGLSSWLPLLITLMAEQGRGNHSHWHPYLSLVLGSMQPGPPMLWGEAERGRLLGGTGLEEKVAGDLERIENDFRNVVLPFMQRHLREFRKALHSSLVFRQLVALVMSYSFTDAEEEDAMQRTVMVPFVDLLNHHSHHHAELSFGRKHLQLVAVRSIRKGEEVMNTYGALPNIDLVHTYGFAEPGNPTDRACIRCECVREAYLQCCPAKQQKRREKWDRLEAEDLLEETYDVDSQGRPEDKLVVLVKLLHSKRLEYHKMKLQLRCVRSSEPGEGRVAGPCSGSESSSLQCCCLEAKEASFLAQAVEHSLRAYPEDHAASQAALESGQKLSAKEKAALLLCLGQQNCLLRLLGRLQTLC